MAKYDSFEAVEAYLSDYSAFKSKPLKPKLTESTAAGHRAFAKQLDAWEEECKKVEAHNDSLKAERQIAMDEWYQMLMLERSDLPAKLRHLLHHKAYEDAHSGGHESVRHKYIDLCDFADDIIKALKES